MFVKGEFECVYQEHGGYLELLCALFTSTFIPKVQSERPSTDGELCMCCIRGFSLHPPLCGPVGLR